MASYSKYNASHGGDDKNLAWDLRQYYATIVGECMKSIYLNKIDNNFLNYYRDLENLYTLIKHKISDREKKKFIEEYEKLNKEVIKKALEYKSVWFKKDTNNSEGITKIRLALMDLEMHLYKNMDDANMFGGFQDEDGL